MRRRGFTLVELLVVMGVIAVLMGLLIPVLGRARMAADRVACGSALRQIGSAFQRYELDWKVWPVTAWISVDPAPSSVSRSRRWFDQISPNLGTPINREGVTPTEWMGLQHGKSPIRGCPRSLTDPTEPDGPGYAMNAAFAAGSGRPQMTNRVMLMATDSFGPMIRGTWTRSSQWTKPAQRALVMDSAGINLAANTWPWWANPTGPMPAKPTRSTFSPDYTRHNSSGMRSGSSSGGLAEVPAINVLFVDMHVDLLSARESHRAVTFQPTYSDRP